MSANLDLVRSIFSTWERGDFSSVEWADPEMEFVTADGTEPGSWAGLAELAEGMRDWLSAWKDARAGADEYRELDNERVLALVQFSGRGKTSGLELGRLSPKGAFLFNVREGKVTRIVRYLDRNRALADLGLEESPVTEESTTPDLVELDRAVEAAFRGDLEPWLSLLRPDCIWDDSAIGLGTHEGLAAIRTHVGDWIGSYEEIENTLEERLDLGHGVMFGVSVQKGRLVGGTGYVQLRYAAVTVWVEGRIKRFTTYTDVDEARAAAERLAQERGQAASRANMQIVLDSYPRLNTGDLATLVPQFYHPDAEWHVASEDPDSAVHHGIEAIRKHIETWIDAYPDQKIEPLEGRANGDQVFVWVRFVGRGAASGAGIEMKLAHVFTLRDGRCARVDVYYDRTEALKAVGLEE